MFLPMRTRSFHIVERPRIGRQRPSVEPFEDRTLLSTPRISEFAVPVAASTISGIVAGPDNNLWFTEPDPVAGNKIGRITPGGTLTEFDIPSPSSQPARITPGPDGNFWFTELAANKVGRITPAGVVTEFTVPTADSRPLGITLGPDGNLWFTQNAGNKVVCLTPIGNFVEFDLPTADRLLHQHPPPHCLAHNERSKSVGPVEPRPRHDPRTDHDQPGILHEGVGVGIRQVKFLTCRRDNR